MKWHAHKDGDRRIRRKFLWLPEVIGNQKVWLESVTVEEKFVVFGSFNFWSHVRYVPEESK